MEKLQTFAEKHLSHYHQRRKDPVAQCQSQLSPYLHFGHVSTLQVILWLREHAPGASTEAWVDELVVRRELARNMTYYNPAGYDDYCGAVPLWARQTLEAHISDPRPRLFSREDLEHGRTDDPAWNAAQHEMISSGHMHNYMRMYWCKQLLLWTRTPREAFEIALWLNDRWELDGRDENGYMGIAWCFGNHDNAFPDRPIFGIVRSMTRSGLKGKVDEARYIEVVRKKCSSSIGRDRRYTQLLPQPKGLLSFFGQCSGTVSSTTVGAAAGAPSLGEDSKETARCQNNSSTSVGPGMRASGSGGRAAKPAHISRPRGSPLATPQAARAAEGLLKYVKRPRTDAFVICD